MLRLRADRDRSRATPLLLISGWLLAHAALFLPVPLILRALAAWTVLAMPGIALAGFLTHDERPSRPERVALAAGLGTAAMVFGGLLLAYAPGPLTRLPVLLGFDGLLGVVVLGGLWLRRRSGPAGGDGPDAARAGGPGWAALALPLALALVFRLTSLGYAEFQGDEARALLMAAGLGQGRDDVLMVHKKGPAEVLLPALVWAAAGGIDEGSARLPFALANIAAILGVVVLGWRLAADAGRATMDDGEGGGAGRAAWVAGIAGVALALDGYFVAFGRIVQYQSIVALMSILGVWGAWRYYQTGRGRWAVTAGALVAVGTLGHYEAVFALPPVAYLIWRRGGLRAGIGPAAVFGLVAAVFYVPFVMHPHFAQTFAYIVNRRVGVGAGGGGPLYNNLVDYFTRATFYNSTWYVLAMALLLAGFLAWQGRRAFPRVGPLAAVWPIVAPGAAVALGGALMVGRFNVAVVLFLPFALLLVARRIDDRVRAALLWFMGPFFVASFLMQKPHTHFYTMIPPWALMVGMVGALSVAWVTRDAVIRARGLRAETAAGLVARPPAAAWGAAALGAGLVLLAAGYLWLVFIRHDVEYKRVYPAARSPLYPVVYGDTPPRGGYFGFPYRAGWGVVGALYADGTLQGNYDSNEEPLITGWYTRGAARCAAEPRYYIVAENVQDEEKIPLARVEREYHLMARVDVDGRPKLRVYSREPVAGVRQFTLANSGRFEPGLATPFPIGQALAEAVPATPVDASFGAIRLVGYDLAAPMVAPGGVVNVALYWEAVEKPGGDLTVFSHLEDSRIWGQHDSPPKCGTRPTSRWQAGELVVEARTLRVDPQTPPGEYPLRVGLYDVTSGRREVARGADTEGGDHAVLGPVTVRP